VTAPAATFLFADIAGFTALTEAHGDEEAATLVADFCDSVKAELPATGGEHIKTIGDALMLRIRAPHQAIPLALNITHELMHGHGAPGVRVGLHHGPAVERDGDYFGATVNLAARVSGVAAFSAPVSRSISFQRMLAGVVIRLTSTMSSSHSMAPAAAWSWC
jgi:adenylate cyclase